MSTAKTSEPKFPQFCQGDEHHERYHGNRDKCPHCGLPPAKTLDKPALNYLIGGQKVRSQARPERDAGDGYVDPYDIEANGDEPGKARRAVVFCRGSVPVPHPRHEAGGMCPVCRGFTLRSDIAL